MTAKNKIRVKFLEDYDDQWKKGDIKLIPRELALALIDQRFAKAIASPIKDKMIRWVKNKGLGMQ